MDVNGPKTIGRTKPQADTSRVDDVVALEESARAGSIEATAPSQRALNIENQDLKRQLAVMTARVAVMNMGGKPGSTKPIGLAFERLQAFEAKMLSTFDMTDAAKLRTINEMAEAVKSWKEREAVFADQVESELGSAEAVQEAGQQWGGR